MDIFNYKIDKLILLIDTINSATSDFNFKINKKEFIKNIYYINKLIHQLYNIYSQNISRVDKIEQILKHSYFLPFFSIME